MYCANTRARVPVSIAWPATLDVGRAIECRQAGLLRLGGDRRRRHVGRADDLLELQAVADGAAAVDAHHDGGDAEGNQDCRGDEPADLEELTHFRLLPQGRCRLRAVDRFDLSRSLGDGRPNLIVARAETDFGFPAANEVRSSTQQISADPRIRGAPCMAKVVVQRPTKPPLKVVARRIDNETWPSPHSIPSPPLHSPRPPRT